MGGNNKPKICLFWPTLGFGGVETSGLRVARELYERGYPVDVVVANARGDLLSKIPPGVSLVNLRSPLGNGKLVLSVFPLAFYLRRHSPAVIMSSMTEVNLIAIIARVISGSRCWLVISERSTLSIRIKHKLRKRLLPFFVRKFYPLADCIHAVSQGVANDLAETTGIQRDKIKVVYNPVVSSELFSKSEEPLDHPWFSSGEPPVVLAVGRLTEAKDFPVLIRAFALVRKERPARLIILGEGAERPKLEALVRELGLNEDVIMPGFVDNPYKYMRNATVFVLSSAWEGFGVVLVEAMALGTAIVSTDCPNGPAEILEGGKWGDLVTVGDWRALASAILKRLEQPENERVKMATERAKEFRTESIVTDYFRYLYPNNMMSYDESKTKINEVDPCS